MSKLFGWMPVLIRIAEKRLWDREGMTPLEAAGEAPLWEAFSILNYENADAQYQKRVSDEMAKDRKKK